MSLDVYLYAPDGSDRSEPLYWGNTTHNLSRMAYCADLYKPLWKPEELCIYTASDLIPHLAGGLVKLIERTDQAMKESPANGWGSYAGLCSFVAHYLAACIDYPDATVSVSR